MQQAVCVRRKKTTKTKTKTKKTPHPKHTTKSTAARRPRPPRDGMKHVPRVSPYSLASMDPGFVEIGLVQLSQSVKTTNVTYTYTEQRNRQTNQVMAPCTHPDMKRLSCLNGLGRLAPSALPHSEQRAVVYRSASLATKKIPGAYPWYIMATC